MTQQLDMLRRRHPKLIYKQYTVDYLADAVHFSAEFLLLPNIVFRPKTIIQGVSEEQWAAMSPEVMHNFAFHLGMAEILSYWKAACPSEIVIEAGYLDEYQLAWWHKLLINGMGEFFYQNQIDFTAPDFVRLYVSEQVTPSPLLRFDNPLESNSVLVPIGGGKDSIVTVETLGEHIQTLGTLALNTTQATEDTIQRSKSSRTIYVKRTIDPTLLGLNQQGYLNGHTPFSSVLAFIAITCAALFNYRYVALSNERSSNEGNQVFHGHVVNHQYSKTYQFEVDFQQYATRYLTASVKYFSYLRPLYELQIAALFAQMKPYHSIFRSCNVGQKDNTWCHSCPKCLFVYTILYPFMSEAELGLVFNHDLFARSDLLPIARELAGLADVKPFECVGTHEESLIAFYLAAQKYRQRGQNLPIILQAIYDEALIHAADLPARAQALLHAWNEEHAVPEHLEKYLRQKLNTMVEQITWA